MPSRIVLMGLFGGVTTFFGGVVLRFVFDAPPIAYPALVAAVLVTATFLSQHHARAGGANSY